jgi:hypothetical protein
MSIFWVMCVDFAASPFPVYPLSTDPELGGNPGDTAGHLCNRLPRGPAYWSCRIQRLRSRCSNPRAFRHRACWRLRATVIEARVAQPHGDKAAAIERFERETKLQDGLPTS